MTIWNPVAGRPPLSTVKRRGQPSKPVSFGSAARSISGAIAAETGPQAASGGLASGPADPPSPPQATRRTAAAAAERTLQFMVPPSAGEHTPILGPVHAI